MARTRDIHDRKRRRGLKRGIVVVMLVTCAIVACVVAGIAVARSATHGAPAALSATQCATPGNYARHTPKEIEQCITSAVRDEFTRRGVLATLISLQRDAHENPMLKSLCHLSLHKLGREQLRAGLSITDLDHPLEQDANWNSLCVGGFLHGYLQGMAEESPPIVLMEVARTWCVDLADQNREGCAHAVGHGLSRSFDNDLRDASHSCRQLAATVRTDCLSGAIMEINFADERLEGRMEGDEGLGPAAKIDCDEVPADQRTWCRAFAAKGKLLVAELRTVG